MIKNNLHLYSIMPLDMDHIDEVCEDIRQQYESGVSNYPLLKMTLVPEGNPPADKVGQLCRKYDAYREKLTAMGIPSGILVQATIGHGWKLGAPFPYQRYTNFTNGAETNTVCPMDEGFHDYLFHIFSTIAAHNPDCVMVDDDFRLMGRPGLGCGCPLHMAEFNKRAGTAFTREELWSIIDTGAAHSEDYGKIMQAVQRDSLIEAAKVMRRGMDSVNPALPGSFCCVGNSTEYAADIAKILAGEGNPIVVRVNNGNYLANGGRNLSNAFLRAAHQIAKLRGKVDVILAETDTCPQNRYSTGAMQLHAHFTGTILEGAAGAKHWITRLAAYEPECGKAYRKILAKNRGFYEELAALVPSLKWRGCRIPVSAEPGLFYSKKRASAATGWSQCVLERLGIPFFFSADEGGAVCLNGNADRMFDDEQMKKVLAGPVFLASDTAVNLIKRGFGEYLGVDVRDWNGAAPSSEKLSVNGNKCGVQVGARELVILSDDVREDSGVYNSVDKENYTYLFPGTTVYKNALGGTAHVFCGTPAAGFNLTEAFSFLNISRKKQLVRMLSDAGELPAYCPSDAEIYMRAADMEDGGLFAAIFNIGLDPMDETEIVCEREVSRIERLMPDGSRRPVDFTKNGSICTLDCPCSTLDPVVLFIY
ncbi:MAG: hypothetical protein E7632_05730 [Ruminococcaceae bacterium]|nr:hypothetical protein [Oscillospiraceae bacterium]